jgi:hypothetical protein
METVMIQKICSPITGCAVLDTSLVMKTPGKVNAFMEQEPRKVAAFVWECME